MKARVWKNRVTIFCPACTEHFPWRVEDHPRPHDIGEHTVPFFGAGPAWQLDGDLERPTLSPSLLVSYDYGEDHQRYVCHSFVSNGRIQYLADCTHPLAGQTVDLQDIPETT
jgi:hypothetical protein